MSIVNGAKRILPYGLVAGLSVFGTLEYSNRSRNQNGMKEFGSRLDSLEDMVNRQVERFDSFESGYGKRQDSTDSMLKSLVLPDMKKYEERLRGLEAREAERDGDVSYLFKQVTNINEKTGQLDETKAKISQIEKDISGCLGSISSMSFSISRLYDIMENLENRR